MKMNRTERRAFNRLAGDVAAKMAGRCYDIQGGAIVPVSNARAVSALTRAFTLLVRAGGQPMALPISEAEADAFPGHRVALSPGAVTYLAVGLDAAGRASYALQSASGTDKAVTHEAARQCALMRLAGICSFPGFPMGETRGRA